MKIDAYTKLVLTVIAICLVWISIGGPSLITSVTAEAQVSTSVQRVIIVGYQEGVVDVNSKALPLPVTQK
jgi:hypothetical protein